MPETAPLIETATSSASETLGSQEVRELPVNRRNVANLLNLAPGVSVGGSGGGMVSMNGVAGGGTAISVDGTEANSNPEGRAVNHYGGQNQISVMSLDSVEEVQIVKGVLPAEYGGVAGGQVNMISRSGTNAFHGTAFYNLQNLKLNARTFLSTTPKPVGTFNQYGGTLGGPIFRNRLFFFATYEGYREKCSSISSATHRISRRETRCWRRCRFPKRKSGSTRSRPTEPSCRRPASSIRTAADIEVSERAGAPRITSWRRGISPSGMAPIWPSPIPG